MSNAELHTDIAQRVVVNTRSQSWQPSPSPSVWRKRLELLGAVESGRVTSVVRYDAGSSFSSHPHPDGEEFLVLDGVFSDEHGDFPAGTFVLNPEGVVHAPRSTSGCVLFVKLRQYPGLDRPQVTIDTRVGAWFAVEGVGVEMLPLYEDSRYPECIRMLRLAPGGTAKRADYPGGQELFVVKGSLADDFGVYETGTWVRHPPGTTNTLSSQSGCEVYEKTRHLGTVDGAARRHGGTCVS